MQALGGPGEDYEQRVDPPRLKQYVYVHNHKCSIQGQQYVYSPPTTGDVMHMARIVCVEEGLELVLIEVRDV